MSELEVKLISCHKQAARSRGNTVFEVLLFRKRENKIALTSQQAVYLFTCTDCHYG